MHIAITGGTGLVGSALTGFLTAQGHDVYILTRNKQNKHNKKRIIFVEWLQEDTFPEKGLPPLDAMVNLAGASLNHYWTDNHKKKIINSRLHSTKEVVRILQHSQTPPEVLINASAVGYYGVSDEEQFTETSHPSGDTFLQRVCEKWEAEAAKAEQFGVRTVYARFGLILDNKEGAFPKLKLPYSLFAGGSIGSGKQWYSWVHLKDVVEMITFAIENKQIDGAMNVTSPHPEQMGNFGKRLAEEINRPHWMHVPAFTMSAILGEMSTLILEGQYVVPEKAIKSGYSFSFPTIEDALKDLTKKTINK